MKCDRCGDEEELSKLLKWTLCPVCMFDASKLVDELVSAGRAKGEYLCSDVKWSHIESIVAAHGYVTTRLFSLATGFDCKASRDSICGYARRGRLDYDKVNKRYVISSKQPVMKASWGERRYQMNKLIGIHGYISPELWTQNYRISRAHAIECIGKAKKEGLVTKVGDGRFEPVRDEHGRALEKAPKYAEAHRRRRERSEATARQANVGVRVVTGPKHFIGVRGPYYLEKQLGQDTEHRTGDK